jgi:deoxyribodipyrimidine photo-lyase
VGEWLATQFLDYEPGIHWSQLQMQSGTTGINTTRVYNPIKQAQDHDPHGVFVRHWLPNLRQVPDSWLYEPWRMAHHSPATTDTPTSTLITHPVMDLQEDTREAKQRLHARRKNTDVQAAKKAVIEKHASRKTLSRRSTASKPTAAKLLGFDFE